jgi:hypothetical protein
MNDPIVDEVRRVRDAHAARFNYDLDAIFADIKEREKKSGLKFVDGVARQPMPNKTLQPTGAAIPVTSETQSLPAAPAAAAFCSAAEGFGMQRLTGCLLVSASVGCGGGGDQAPASAGRPASPQPGLDGLPAGWSGKSVETVTGTAADGSKVERRTETTVAADGTRTVVVYERRDGEWVRVEPSGPATPPTGK